MNTSLKLFYLLLAVSFGIPLFVLGFLYEALRTFFSIGRFKASDVGVILTRKRKRA
jgi:hypothetical protein